MSDFFEYGDKHGFIWAKAKQNHDKNENEPHQDEIVLKCLFTFGRGECYIINIVVQAIAQRRDGR